MPGRMFVLTGDDCRVAGMVWKVGVLLGNLRLEIPINVAISLSVGVWTI